MVVKPLFNRNRLNLLLALLAGASLPLAFAPFSFFPLAVLAPAILFYLWLDSSPKQAALTGFVFGAGMFGMGVSWVFVAIHVHGHSPVPLAVVLTALFVSVLAACFALQGAISAWLRVRLHAVNKSNTYILVLVFPVVWVLTEWFRGWFLTGFPWLNLGYSQIDSVLSGYAPLVGVYGVSLIVVLIASLVLLLLLDRQRNKQIGLLLLIIALIVSGYFLSKIEFTQPVDGPIKASLIQGNQPQITKWDAVALQTRLDTYAALTAENWDSQLIVWPENAVTTFYHHLPKYFAQLQQQAIKHQTDIVLGVPVFNKETEEYYSSMVSMGQTPGQFHKRHLVPFGEFLPLDALLRGFISFFDLPMSSFSAGSDAQPLLRAAGQPLAISICYEDAFGEEVIDLFPEATLLVNGSNNAWYGDSFAPHQHLQISRMRALETGRPLLRVTTNGISAFVDHKGVITHQSPQFETYVLKGTVQPRQGSTPYIRFGNLPVVIVSLLVLVLVGTQTYRTVKQ